MANTKISAMTTAGTLDGTELLPLVQNSANKQATLDTIAAFAQGDYGAFQDFTTQTAALANTGYAIKFGTTDFSKNITIASNSRITCANAGLYNLQWSGQFNNSSGSLHDVRVWLKINGTNLTGSTGFISVPNSHGGTDGHIVSGWNYFVNLTAGQYVELWWETDNTAVSLLTNAAGTHYPTTASVIATVSQVN
jgi:hypothetical protein